MNTFTKEDKIELLQKKFLEVCERKGYDPVRELDRAIDFLEVTNMEEESFAEDINQIRIPMIPYIKDLIDKHPELQSAINTFTTKIFNSEEPYKGGLDLEGNRKRGSHGATLMFLWDNLFELRLQRKPLADIVLRLAETHYTKIKNDVRKREWYRDNISVYILNLLTEDETLRNQIIQEYVSNQ